MSACSAFPWRLIPGKGSTFSEAAYAAHSSGIHMWRDVSGAVLSHTARNFERCYDCWDSCKVHLYTFMTEDMFVRVEYRSGCVHCLQRLRCVGLKLRIEDEVDCAARRAYHVHVHRPHYHTQKHLLHALELFPCPLRYC